MSAMDMTSNAATGADLENPYADGGAVVLDIGGDVGALAVTMPASTVGLEVEIRPFDDQSGRAHAHDHGHTHLAHVAVVARPVQNGRVPSLVFGELASGRYELFEKGCPRDVALRVEVTGGAVTTADWPQ
jgi:hypothetical protein